MRLGFAPGYAARLTVYLPYRRDVVITADTLKDVEMRLSSSMQTGAIIVKRFADGVSAGFDTDNWWVSVDLAENETSVFAPGSTAYLAVIAVVDVGDPNYPDGKPFPMLNALPVYVEWII